MTTTINPAQIDPKLIKKIRNLPCQSKEELDAFFVYFFGVHLAKTPLYPGNSSPLDFAWDIYSTAMSASLTANDVTSFLAMAARGGQKTLTCACIISILLLHDQFRDVIHMASIAAQANVLFEVWLNKFAARQYLTDAFPKLTMRRTTAHTGRMLTVTHGTMDAVNAHHGGILIQDEVDLTDPVVFDESKGMLVASRGRVPMNVMISSRKYAMGNIQKILDKIEEEPDFAKHIAVHRWGQLETTMRCTEERSGDFGTTIMVNEDELIALSEAEFENVPNNERIKYQPMVGFKNCLRCGIFSFCQGLLKNQTENPYLTPIDVTVSYFQSESAEFFQAQRLNRRPSTKGLVYGSYDSKVHDLTDQQMAERWTGDAELAKSITNFAALVDLAAKQKMPLYIGVDFGYNEASAELITIDRLSRVYVIDELAAEGLNDPELAIATHNKWGQYPINYIFPDWESPGGIKAFKKVWEKTCGICTDANKDVDYGLNLVRSKIFKPGTKEPHFFISKTRNPRLRHSLRNYQYKIDSKLNEPTESIYKKWDHPADAVRYVLATIMGITPFTVSFGMNEGTPEERPVATIGGQPSMIHAPTGTEIMRYAGKIGGGNIEDVNAKKEEETPKGGFWWHIGEE